MPFDGQAFSRDFSQKRAVRARGDQDLSVADKMEVRDRQRAEARDAAQRIAGAIRHPVNAGFGRAPHRAVVFCQIADQNAPAARYRAQGRMTRIGARQSADTADPDRPGVVDQQGGDRYAVQRGLVGQFSFAAQLFVVRFVVIIPDHRA